MGKLAAHHRCNGRRHLLLILVDSVGGGGGGEDVDRDAGDDVWCGMVETDEGSDDVDVDGEEKEEEEEEEEIRSPRSNTAIRIFRGTFDTFPPMLVDALDDDDATNNPCSRPMADVPPPTII